MAQTKTLDLFLNTPALVSYRVRCGKPNCRCAKGEGHGPYWYLRWREGSVQRRHYVRQAEVLTVRALIERRRQHDRDERQAANAALADLRRLRQWLKELNTGRLP